MIEPIHFQSKNALEGPAVALQKTSKAPPGFQKKGLAAIVASPVFPGRDGAI
ncbi:hypothetical protein [Desulfovibrio sp. ZJ369]|uniref:hypothetical protein n=1 Tax=Desulfovibrio sp. ZJ369 TaxID=2709793 RepID=UPI0013EBF496|nr:hypothetical protein [Desulfovibrio sp. ZJ369]